MLAAIEGRQINFILGKDWVINGWLCGMDDYHWKVVGNDGDVMLIHKSMCVVSIPRDGTIFDDLGEEDQTLLAPVVAPFRQAMERERRPTPDPDEGARKT